MTNPVVGDQVRISSSSSLPAALEGHFLDKHVTVTLDQNMLDGRRLKNLLKRGALNTTPPVVTDNLVDASTSASGSYTAPNGTVITVYINGTSAGTTTISSNAWTKTGLTLAIADKVSASIAGFRSLGASDVGLPVLVYPNAPTVTSPISDAATTVAGTTVTVPDGSAVKIYNNGTLVASGTVTSNAFSVTVPAVSTGNSITAKVIVSGLTSAASSAVVVTH
jgi:hypothetical protein